MIGEIVSILADRERHSRVLENSNFPSDPPQQEDLWEAVLAEARDRGFTVEFSGNYVNLSRAECSRGSFQYNKGGALWAREFLKGE